MEILARKKTLLVGHSYRFDYKLMSEKKPPGVVAETRVKGLNLIEAARLRRGMFSPDVVLYGVNGG